ncbi:HtaA domain-containing protein [Corynebacterium felinum]|uniref:Biotin carboxyl carrier protein n=1 Tax=Corynebacterium felinum TaxID=131318 RepID=A0ABU2B4Q2_9CORY|nr:HtaA domain-containing protein [Corynebacterium felinum]MDF5819662.1 HtaA domain-containing protein [Corynebacterium felinum]MDR7353588.1 biotin carboxyl carrier protein [Corynebacterium felinum]WJY95768.1 Htaa [Corynebacterium felinum]
MKLRTSLIALTAGSAVAFGGVVVPQAFADDPAQCANPEITVESGTLKWGIKQSWRAYVTGPIAKGDWTVTGATDNGKSKGANDFQFHFEVNPSGTVVNFNPDGTVKSATIKTIPSTVKFKGHHGALESTMKSPFIEAYVEGGKTVVRPGVTYEGYYVEGKGMTDYTPDDRVPENLKSGTDSFAKGESSGWVLQGDTLKLDATALKYEKKPGTRYDEATKKQYIEGVDIIFMGTYSDTYKPEVDDVNVELKVKKTCPQAPAPQPTDPAPQPTDPAPKPTTTAPKPTTTAPKPTTTAPKPTTTAPKPTTTAPKPSGTTSTPAPQPPAKTDWKKILFGILGAVGVLAVIGGIVAALQQFNLIPGFKLPKF